MASDATNPAEQYVNTLEQRVQLAVDLKEAIKTEIQNSTVLNALFPAEDLDAAADAIVNSADSLRQAAVVRAAGAEEQRARLEEHQAAIEDARDKRSADEIEADRIRKEVEAEASAHSERPGGGK